MRKLTIKMDMNHEKIGLKPVEAQDANDIYKYASNENVKKYIGWPLMKSLKETQDFVETLQGKDEANTHAHASVIHKKSGKVIGTIIIFGADEEANHCELGYVLSEETWNKGYGTALVEHICQSAFDLGFEKIYARVCSQNIGSQVILKKNGFKQEAVLENYYCIEGIKQDCIYLSRVK